MLTLPSGRKLLALDLLVVVWSIAWIVIGITVAETFGELTRLTGGFRSVGSAVAGVGEILGNLNVPLVGEALDRASQSVRDAGRDIVARSDVTRDEIQRAAVLIGAAVALIPILTLLLPYAPARISRAAEAAALRRLLAAGAGFGDPGLESFLAGRALDQVPYRRLAAIAERPWEIDSASTRRALAEEELRRLGLSPALLDGAAPAGRPDPADEPPP